MTPPRVIVADPSNDGADVFAFEGKFVRPESLGKYEFGVANDAHSNGLRECIRAADSDDTFADF